MAFVVRDTRRSTTSQRTFLKVGSLSLFVILLLFVWLLFPTKEDAKQQHAGYWKTTTTTTGQQEQQRCVPEKGLRPIKDRYEIGDLLEEMNIQKGAEIGVQRGRNAKEILSRWKSCTEFHLVDLWEHQENYKDLANVDNEEHNKFYIEAQENLKPWESKTFFYRMLSTEAAKKFEPQSLDFVYIDARNDYCGTTEDIAAYWPLIKPGGIMAGHDFLSASEDTNDQDWSLCKDGTRKPEAVKGAVLDFMVPRGVTVSVSYKDQGWPTWMVQKPMCGE